MLYIWLSFITILLMIEIINYKEPYTIYMYDKWNKPILDSNNVQILNTELFPSLDVSNATLINMFQDIDFCDNLDDISYTTDTRNNTSNYYLLDDYTFYNTYEGFSQIYCIEKIYLFILGILLIWMIVKKYNY